MISNNKRNGSVAHWPLLALWGFSGYSFNLIGNLFIGDLLTCIFCILFVFKLKGIPGRVLFWLYIFSFSLVVFGVILDASNGLEIIDFEKGTARNFVFGASIIAGFCFSIIYGFRFMAKLLLATLISLLIVEAIHGAYFDFSFWAKDILLNVIVLSLIIMLPSRTWGFFVAANLFLINAYFYWLVFDSRVPAAAGIVMALISMAVIVTRYSPKLFSYLRRPLVIFCALVVGYLFVNELFYNTRAVSTSFDSRREVSSSERMDMVRHAWNGFLDKPLIGHGSWQHTIDYSLYSGKDYIIGVHSWIMQFAYEYGFLGLAYGICIFIIGLCALSRIFDALRVAHLKEEFGMELLVLFYFVMGICVSCLLGPFAGYQKMYQGLALGAAIAFLHVSKRILPGGRRLV